MKLGVETVPYGRHLLSGRRCCLRSISIRINWQPRGWSSWEKYTIPFLFVCAISAATRPTGMTSLAQLQIVRLDFAKNNSLVKSQPRHLAGLAEAEYTNLRSLGWSWVRKGLLKAAYVNQKSHQTQWNAQSKGGIKGNMKQRHRFGRYAATKWSKNAIK